jgi:hypothetical protein
MPVAEVAAISPEPAFRVRRHALAHIPGDEGWPVIGRTLNILADPKGEVERMAAKHGPVYRTRCLAKPAQEVISNPGYCAPFYPDANCQNKGPNNPCTGDDQLRREMRGSYALSEGPCTQGAAFYRGRDGGRHYCY